MANRFIELYEGRCVNGKVTLFERMLYNEDNIVRIDHNDKYEVTLRNGLKANACPACVWAGGSSSWYYILTQIVDNNLDVVTI